jgi:S-adenosylmethionine:tRNA ribosyltransferase-isomerase
VHISQFDFDLPADLIAQEPPPQREGSRLLVLSRDTGAMAHDVFSNLGQYLRRGDLLVVNDTRVFPARLIGQRVPSGGRVECLLLERAETELSADDRGEGEIGERWLALVHPGQKLKPGARVLFESEGLQLHGEILARHFQGRRTIRLWTDDPAGVDAIVDRIGHIPLPPYIKRDDRPDDRARYQTVYADARGSVAAPTAGLHFAEDRLSALESAGIELARVTLHVGYGTFKPIRVESVDDHVVDPEPCAVTDAAAESLTRARRERRRIIAVGTTTVRALESLRLDDDGRVQTKVGMASIFIRPGHRFQLVDGLVTNFHLPRSSLLLLVAAFAGRERLLAAYREAIARGYRFYSYGDAMLIV